MHPKHSFVTRLHQQQGFTLLELLIASIIFALMAVMAYGGLANVLDNSEASDEALLRLKKLQQAVSVMNRDFSQIVERPIRDEYGNEQPFLIAGNDVDNIVEFTRGGRNSPAVLLRSSLVRVAYRFDEDTLVRLHWPQLDRSPNMEPKKSVLIDDIESVKILFLNGDNEWVETWPPITTTPAVIPSPKAIEVTLQLNDWGDIRRLYATE